MYRVDYEYGMWCVFFRGKRLSGWPTREIADSVCDKLKNETLK